LERIGNIETEESEASSWIEVELYYLAEHLWKTAPVHREYLRLLHQHLFKVVVRISVEHGERQIEFHDLRQEVWRNLNTRVEWNNSCENIAKSLFLLLQKLYKKHKISVVVCEEGGVCGKYGHEVI